MKIRDIMGLGGFVKKVFSGVKFTKRDYDPKQLSIDDIHLPLFTRGRTKQQLQNTVNDILDSMQLLNYNKSSTLNSTVEWNSYIVSMLLKIYKEDESIEIRSTKLTHYFSQDILNLGIKELQGKVNSILHEYKNNIKVTSLEDEMFKDIRWNGLDMSYLVYFLYIYKDRR